MPLYLASFTQHNVFETDPYRYVQKQFGYFYLFIYLFIYLFGLFFLGSHQWHMEVSRLEAELEL